MQDSQVGRVMYEEDELVWYVLFHDLQDQADGSGWVVNLRKMTIQLRSTRSQFWIKSEIISARLDCELMRREWDCPTDILYHHAESEDHVRPIPVQRDQVDTV